MMLPEIEVVKLDKINDAIITTSPIEPRVTELPDVAEVTNTENTTIKEKQKLPPPISFPEVPPISDSQKNAAKYHYLVTTAYRRVFALIFLLNLSALIGLLIWKRGQPPQLSYNLATSVNILFTVLGRQENFVNLLYEVFCSVPHSWPLWIRKRLARVYHYGGVHSGCGLSAIMWFILQSILVTIEYCQNWRSTLWTLNLVTSWWIIFMLLIVSISAYPKFRVKYHNRFENLHRWSGLSALLVFWIHLFVILLLEQEKDWRDDDILSERFGKRLVTTASFWLLLISTSCGLISWSRLRLRPVVAEHLGEKSIGHAIRLHFMYKDMRPFYGVKVSTNPHREWHSFATIPDKRGGFSVLVSNAGDWTSQIVNDPPKALWVRGQPLHGLAYTSRLFKQIVVVATGSGIGPMLSLFASHVVPARVLWSTPNPVETFGQEIIDDVYAADKEAVVWDTRKHGRPDLVRLSVGLVRESRAEAVYVISNKSVTNMLVVELQGRGINVVGVIWDS